MSSSITRGRPPWLPRAATACLGVFLDDPTDVPAEVVDYLAQQLPRVDLPDQKMWQTCAMTTPTHLHTTTAETRRSF
jgi:hypothetical protein